MSTYDMFPLDSQICNIFNHEIGNQKLLELGFPPAEIFFNALTIADNNFELCLEFNDTKYIARYGYFKQEIGLNLRIHDDWQMRYLNNQSCLVSDKERKIIILATGNDALGHLDGNITTATLKGKNTKLKILANNGNYEDKSMYQTWFLLYPSRLDTQYFTEQRCINMEMVYFNGIDSKFDISGKEKIQPTNPLCRIIMRDHKDLTHPKDFNKTDLNNSGKITEDDFLIEFKTG